MSLVIYNNMANVFIMYFFFAFIMYLIYIMCLCIILFAFPNSGLFNFGMSELHVCYELILFLLQTQYSSMKNNNSKKHKLTQNESKI